MNDNNAAVNLSNYRGCLNAIRRAKGADSYAAAYSAVHMAYRAGLPFCGDEVDRGILENAFHAALRHHRIDRWDVAA